MINDAGKQPEEEAHRAGFEMVPSTELLSPWSWGAPPLWCMDMFTNPPSSPNALSFRVLMEVSLCRYGWLNHWPLRISSVGSPSSLLRGQGWG